MKQFLRALPVFNADGAGGGAPGGAPPPAAAAAAGGQPTPAVPPPAAPPPGGGAPPAPAADYWPDGLDPGLKGADSKATLDNMARLANDLKGYRDRDAKRGVPEKPEGYADFSDLKDFKVDAELEPHFKALGTDPVFKGVLGTLHKHGLGKMAVAEIYRDLLVASKTAGMLEPALDVEAELAALVPDQAKSLPKPDQDAAVQKRLNENYAFLDLAVQNMGLPKEVAKHAELALGDAARGHQFMEWVRGLVQAGQSQGPGAHGNPAGADTADSLRAEMAQLEKQKHAPDYAEKLKALQDRYKRFYGR